MKKIVHYLKDYLSDNFSWKLYAVLACYIAAVIAFDYTFHFQETVLYRLSGLAKWLAFTAFYGTGFLGASAIIAWHRNNWSVFADRWFWVFFGLCFLMLGLYKSINGMIAICEHVPTETCAYTRKIVRYLSAIVTITIPSVVLWRLFDANNPAGFFGINRQKFEWRPYIWMLAIMMPIIGTASFLPGFIKYYPLYKKTMAFQFAAHYGMSEWPFTIVFELLYAMNFVNVELFFRGVLVWLMFRFLGKDSVLAMVAVYAMFHFVKPLGETISSVFGGFVLGVISLQTRSIWGGICIHVSIAWLMELTAWLQNELR